MHTSMTQLIRAPQSWVTAKLWDKTIFWTEDDMLSSIYRFWGKRGIQARKMA